MSSTTINQRSSGAVDREIGQIMRARRLAKGISQSDLGDTLGISFQQIQKYEKGTNRITAARLVEIADALDVPIEIFFTAASGVKKNPSGLATTEPFSLLKTALGIRLLRDFHQLNDQRTREILVQLAEQIAKRDSDSRSKDVKRT